MKNVYILPILFVTLLLTSCSSDKSKNAEALKGVHKVVVKEVLQANAYTYMLVTENEKDQWIAVQKMEAKQGETYYFKAFMEMKYFESKDLGRVFESVYFIEDLKSDINDFMPAEHIKLPADHMGGEIQGKRPEIAKEELTIEPVEGGITIAELYTNKEKYKNTKVIIRGKVIKTNYGIMERNWFHIQDGTSANGKFDLTIASLEEDVKENDTITFEGVVVLDKDFGYGYLYEVLIEDGKVIK